MGLDDELEQPIAPVTRTPAAQPDSTASKELPALRILLVEDTEDNLFLIRSYLKDSGCWIDEATDGAAAFEKFKSGSYDLVFMDVQMPVMDGHTATRLIREWESEKEKPPVPIVALTAHALPEEVRKSLEAGSTAHLTKPIAKNALLEAVRLYGRPPGSAPQPSGTQAHDAVDVRVDPRLRDLVPWFLENRRKEVDVLRAALERSDFETVWTLGHNMKGSGAGYGFNRITELGASLEQAAARHVREEIRARAAELVSYLDGLHVEYE